LALFVGFSSCVARVEPREPSPTTGRLAAPTFADNHGLIRAYWELSAKKATTADYERFIREHPSIVTAKADLWGSALHSAALFTPDTDGLLALLRAGAVVPEGPLSFAATSGFDGLVKHLLDSGYRDDAKSSALVAAAKYGHPKILRMLLASGSNVNVRTEEDGYTPLHHAITSRSVEAVRVLLSARPPLEAGDDYKRTALFLAVYAHESIESYGRAIVQGAGGSVGVAPDDSETVRLLLEAGARIDATDAGGNTPLHEAVLYGSTRGIELLLARGARLATRNRAGETPLSLARKLQKQEFIRLMQRTR